MPITLCDMIHKDSIEFVQRIDSSKIQTLASEFPRFVLNGEPIHNDSVSFIGYRSRDSSVELGANIWADGQRTITFNIRMGEKNIGWLISYKECQDSAGVKYFAEKGWVLDYVKLARKGDAPIIFEGKTTSFNTEYKEKVFAANEMTLAGAGERAIFGVNSNLGKILSNLGQAAFDRTRDIIASHKNGEWLRRR